MKEWQIAQLMFGKNTKIECAIVKNIMKKYTVESLYDNWSVIYGQNDECGWLIPNECLIN